MLAVMKSSVSIAVLAFLSIFSVDAAPNKTQVMPEDMPIIPPDSAPLII